MLRIAQSAAVTSTAAAVAYSSTYNSAIPPSYGGVNRRAAEDLNKFLSPLTDEPSLPEGASPREDFGRYNTPTSQKITLIRHSTPMAQKVVLSRYTNAKKIDRLKVYLAGPDCFAKDASERYDAMKAKATSAGMDAISPLDSEVDIHSPDILKTIFRINIQDIEEADVVLANVEAFRGTCVDDGTAFELGYAFARAKKLMVYTPDSATPMKHRIAKELSTKGEWLKKDEFPRMEDFPGCQNPGPVNLMITEAVRSTEGGVIAKSFDECIDLLESQHATPVRTPQQERNAFVQPRRNVVFTH
jgi:nucleoside 2-deoxyribosyltransferase